MYEMTSINVTTIQPAISNLRVFAESYGHFHGYVSICVCVFGIVTNLFNISGKMTDLDTSSINDTVQARGFSPARSSRGEGL